MSRLLGVKSVVCTCGEEMERTGGQFGGSVTYDTYYCRTCHKAVNVVDLSKETVKEMEDLLLHRG